MSDTVKKWHESQTENQSPQQPKKRKRLTKLENWNLEQRFILDFGTGKYSVRQLSRKYKINWQKLLKLKHKHFGKGSIKRLRMYQMHLSGIPTHGIADYFDTHPVQVHKAIREMKKKG